MHVSKRGPGRPRKLGPGDGQIYMERDTTKKVKIEDEMTYNPKLDNDYGDSNSASDGNYRRGGGDDDEFDDYQPRGWTSTTSKFLRRTCVYGWLENKNKGRHDNSLSVLTRKFLQLIRNSPNLTVDLNDAVRELNVQKRRIYDITNVLEGIGFIQKVLKNKIKWIGKTDSFEDDDDIQTLSEELESLILEEKEVTNWSNHLQEMLTDLAKDDVNNKYSFVSFEDIKAVNAQNKESDQPFLVIRAPKGTLLEVPNAQLEGPEEFPHKMKLTSQHEEIFIYVVSNDPQEGAQQVVGKPAF